MSIIFEKNLRRVDELKDTVCPLTISATGLPRPCVGKQCMAWRDAVNQIGVDHFKCRVRGLDGRTRADLTAATAAWCGRRQEQRSSVMSKAVKLNPGDRIAYAAKFLKNTGQFTGPSGQRRGTFVAYDRSAPQFARVHWDDFDAKASGDQWGEDYALDALLNGRAELRE